MKYFIIYQTSAGCSDITIVKVDHDMIELFESVHKGQILGHGSTLEEAITGYNEKYNSQVM